jgi:hypothetical protein
MHTEHGPDAVSRKVCNEVPVIGQVRQDKPGREQPDTGFYDTDIGSEAPMPLADVDGPDRLEACFSDPCDKDEQGYNCRRPQDNRSDVLPHPYPSVSIRES